MREVGLMNVPSGRLSLVYRFEKSIKFTKVNFESEHSATFSIQTQNYYLSEFYMISGIYFPYARHLV